MTMSRRIILFGLGLFAAISIGTVVAESEAGNNMENLRGLASAEATCKAKTTCKTCAAVAACGWCFTTQSSGKCLPQGSTACVPPQFFVLTKPQCDTVRPLVGIEVALQLGDEGRIGSPVVQDEQAPIPTPYGSSFNGWYFNKLANEGSRKINWYLGTQSSTTSGNALASCAWMEVVFLDQYDNENPFFAVYSSPTGSGDAKSWYHARVRYVAVGTVAQANAVPLDTPVVLYYGDTPYNCGYNRAVAPSKFYQLQKSSDDSAFAGTDFFKQAAVSTNSADMGSSFIVRYAGVRTGTSAVSPIVYTMSF